MSLSPDHTRRIQRVLNELQTILKMPPGKTAKFLKPARIRRTGKELEAFKKAIVAERKRGIPVSDLATKYGVTPSYIYQLPASASTAQGRKRKAPVKVARKARKTKQLPTTADVASTKEAAEATS